MSRTIVTIPTYNSEAFIAHIMQSIQGQSYENFALYVVDDCSKDNTVDIVQKIAQKDERIHLERNETNLGLTGNFRRCADIAFREDADFFLLICHDDVIYTDYLREKVSVMESDSSVVMVCNATDIINSSGKRLMVRKTQPDGISNGKQCVQKSLYKGNIFGEPSGVLLRVEAMKKAGQFDERFFYSLDWEYFSRVALQGNVAYLGQPLNAFRVSDTSASSRILKNMKKLREEHTLVIKTLCGHLGIRPTWWRLLLSNLLFIAKSWVKRVIFRLGA